MSDTFEAPEFTFSTGTQKATRTFPVPDLPEGKTGWRIDTVVEFQSALIGGTPAPVVFTAFLGSVSLGADRAILQTGRVSFFDAGVTERVVGYACSTDKFDGDVSEGTLRVDHTVALAASNTPLMGTWTVSISGTAY